MATLDQGDGSPPVMLPSSNPLFNGIKEGDGDMERLAMTWWNDLVQGEESAVSNCIELFFHISGVLGFKYSPDSFPERKLPSILSSKECITDGSPLCLVTFHLNQFREFLTVAFSANEYFLLLQRNTMLEKVKSTIELLINGAWLSCRLTASATGMSLLTLIIDARHFLDSSSDRSREVLIKDKKTLMDLHNWLNQKVTHKIPRDLSSKVRIIFIDEVKLWATTNPLVALSKRWREMILWELVDDKTETRISALQTVRILIQSETNKNSRRDLFNYVKKHLANLLQINQVAELVIKIFDAASKDFISDIDDEIWRKIYGCALSTDERVTKAACKFITTSRFIQYSAEPAKFLRHLVALQMEIFKDKEQVSQWVKTFFDVMRETISIDHWIDLVVQLLENHRLDPSVISNSLTLFCGFVRHVFEGQSDYSTSESEDEENFLGTFTRKFPEQWFKLVNCGRVVINVEALVASVELISYTSEFLQSELREQITDQLFQLSLNSNDSKVIRECFKAVKQLSKNMDSESELSAKLRERQVELFESFVVDMQHYSSLSADRSQAKLRLIEFAKLFEIPHEDWNTCYEFYLGMTECQEWTNARVEAFETISDVLWMMIMIPYKKIIERSRGLPESSITPEFMATECGRIMSRVLDLQQPLREMMKRIEHPIKAYYLLADVLTFFGPFLVEHACLGSFANAIYPNVSSLVLDCAEKACADHQGTGQNCCQIVKRAMELIWDESIEVVHLQRFLFLLGPKNEDHSLIILECMKTYSDIKSQANRWKLAMVIASYFFTILKSDVKSTNAARRRRIAPQIEKIQGLIVWWVDKDPGRLSIHQDTLVELHKLVLDTARVPNQARVLQLIKCLHPFVHNRDARPLLNLLESYKEDAFLTRDVMQFEQHLLSIGSKQN